MKNIRVFYPKIFSFWIWIFVYIWIACFRNDLFFLRMNFSLPKGSCIYIVWTTKAQIIFLFVRFLSFSIEWFCISLSVITDNDQKCEVLMFVCSKMDDETILALNCLLQVEQERSEGESSVGDALALAFRWARFCSVSLILFASYLPAPLLMRPRHFDRSYAICSYGSVDIMKSLREALRVCLYRFFWRLWDRFLTYTSP